MWCRRMSTRAAGAMSTTTLSCGEIDWSFPGHTPRQFHDLHDLGSRYTSRACDSGSDFL